MIYSICWLTLFVMALYVPIWLTWLWGYSSQNLLREACYGWHRPHMESCFGKSRTPEK